MIVDDVAIEMMQAGLGQRPLLLCHGFTGAKEDFAQEIDALADRGWHVVAPDLPGHGRSGHPDEPGAYSIARFVRVIAAVADELGWDRFVLLGHSMGGMVAQQFAIDHGDRLDALVLMDTANGGLSRLGLPRDQIDAARHVVSTAGIEALMELQRGRTDALASPAHQRLLDTVPGYQEFCDRKMIESSAVMYTSMLDEMVDLADTVPALRAVAVPTLVMVGDQDTPFVGPSEALASAIPGARLVVIPDAGHSPQFENPIAWRTALTEFLDAIALA